MKGLKHSLLTALGCLIIMGCGNEAKDEDDSTNDGETSNNNETNGNDPTATGALALGSASLRNILEAANEDLSANGQSTLAISSSYIESLPNGSLSIDAEGLNLLEADKGGIAKFSWFIQRLMLSEDGTEWVELYNGSAVEFNLIDGTTAANGISADSVAPGTYNYAYIETTEIKWRRDGEQCEEDTMNVNIAAILTTSNTAKSYFNDTDAFDILFNYDASQYPDVEAAINDTSNDITDRADYLGSIMTKTPSQLASEGALVNTDNVSFDDFYFYLHTPITITAGNTESLIFTLIPTTDISSEEDCDAAPGKPQFLLAPESDVVEAVSFTGEK